MEKDARALRLLDSKTKPLERELDEAAKELHQAKTLREKRQAESRLDVVNARLEAAAKELGIP